MQCEFRNKPNTRRGINWRGTLKGKSRRRRRRQLSLLQCKIWSGQTGIPGVCGSHLLGVASSSNSSSGGNWQRELGIFVWAFLAHFIRMGKCDIRPLESDEADALSRIAIWESQISHRESRIEHRLDCQSVSGGWPSSGSSGCWMCLATVAAKRQCQRPHDLLPVLGVGNGIWELGVACCEL